jgi:putative CocE/NonD family hydrolase
MVQVRRMVILIAALFFLPVSGTCAQSYAVKMERGVSAAMRDGVVLRADVYRPDADGKFPVLLQRTPYNKDGGFEFGLRAAAQGYVVVIQDVRGRYTSEGNWEPFRHESNDGYDTVEWAAALPYSNGKVGMFGGSYVGATQMLAAIAHPPHLVAIFPFVTASNYHENWTYQGGAFEQWFNESWTSGLAQNTLDRNVSRYTDARQGIQSLPLSEYQLFSSPYRALDASLENLAPYFLDWLAHPAYDDYWKRWAIEEDYSRIKVPVYNAGAWYDIFLGGTLRNYLGLKSQAGTPEARQGQRLMIGVGGHAGPGPVVGDVDFGPNSTVDLDAVMLRWYDYRLKGEANGTENEKPVRIFVMGVNQWRDEDAWPPSGVRQTRWFLHSSGHGNGLAGDGSLLPNQPAGDMPDKFVFDPANPVPTLGGNLCCDSRLKPGARDQRPNEAREDVLVYSSQPFGHNYEVTGPVSLELYASSSAVDTDFTAKLVDVSPDGFARNLTEGILRARYRNSTSRADFLNPGQVYKLTVDMWATSNVFLRGHRLRLEVSSSNFPRFDRNPNNGDDPENTTHYVKATNTIYHDSQHPSALVVDVMPR